MMTSSSSSPSLNPDELVDIADALAHAAEDGGVDARRPLARIGLSPAAFNLSQRPQGVWYEIVRAVHAGRSAKAGFQRDAVARLVEALTQELSGNADLSALAHSLGRSPAVHPASPHPRSIFLSYATKDRPDVDRLFLALTARAPTLPVFQDYRSIAPGADWLQTLRGQAGSASLMACWLTPAYLASAFCNYEIGVAESHRCSLLPIVADASVLPAMPAYLSQRQGLRPATPLDMDVVAQAVLVALP